MKKLFVSVPMKGRTTEAIKHSINKMHKIAEAMAEEPLELIDSWIEEEPPEDCTNYGVWYLGKSILMLSQADYFIGVDEPWRWSGCLVEDMTAEKYKIKKFNVNTKVVAQDALDFILEGVIKDMQESINLMSDPVKD
jgi:hypothetical protein